MFEITGILMEYSVMVNQRKLQVFISSTYIDLLDERQSAVESILKAGHIPAGMELFTATNKSQWEVIKRWIDESDVYMLILGGRYGSIESESGKSYTHLEYEYAQLKDKPLFSVVIDESILGQRRSDFIEKENQKQLQEFRQIVLSNMSSFFKDSKDIKLAVHESLGQLNQDYTLEGWVRGNLQSDDIAKEVVVLNEQIRELSKENESLKRTKLERMPELYLKINKENSLVMNFYIDNNVLYKDRQPIHEIPEYLEEFLSQEKVDEYNQELSEIDDERVNKYNFYRAKAFSLEELCLNLEIEIENLGTLKASDVNISITFPDFICITDNDAKSIQNHIVDALEKSLEFIPNPLSDPLREAKIEYKKSLLPKYPILANPLLENLLYRQTPLETFSNHLRLNALQTKLINKDFIKGNSIKIRLDNLLHGHNANYANYCIAPLKKGKGVIKIELHCEEYLESRTQEIPITVNS